MTTIPDLPTYVLTVHQPWAWAIFYGDPLKDVENRHWKPTRPCVLLIHAGRKTDFTAFKFLKQLGLRTPLTSQLVYGSIIGAVTVSQWTRTSLSPWADQGAWHWLLENPVPFDKPIPARGRPGLFVPPAGWRAKFG